MEGKSFNLAFVLNRREFGGNHCGRKEVKDFLDKVWVSEVDTSAWGSRMLVKEFSKWQMSKNLKR